MNTPIRLTVPTTKEARKAMDGALEPYRAAGTSSPMVEIVSEETGNVVMRGRRSAAGAR